MVVSFFVSDRMSIEATGVLLMKGIISVLPLKFKYGFNEGMLL